MKTLFVVVSLAAALLAAPAVAQLGPAGVPGAPGLAETDPSVKPRVVVAPPAAPVQAPKAATTDCSKAKKLAQCKKRQEAIRKAQDAECSKSSDPARCEQYRKTRALCKDKPGPDYRQCLRDNLAPKK